VEEDCPWEHGRRAQGPFWGGGGVVLCVLGGGGGGGFVGLGCVVFFGGGRGTGNKPTMQRLSSLGLDHYIKSLSPVTQR